MEKFHLSNKMIKAMVVDHQEINKMIEKTTTSFNNTPCAEQIKTIKDTVSRLKDRLIHHLKLEEEYGVLEGLVVDAPHIEYTVGALLREHEGLVQEITLLDQRSKKLSCENIQLIESCKESFECFVFNLKEHERKEDSLIMDVHHQDIGGSE